MAAQQAQPAEQQQQQQAQQQQAQAQLQQVTAAVMQAVARMKIFPQLLPVSHVHACNAAYRSSMSKREQRLAPDSYSADMRAHARAACRLCWH